MSTEVQPRIAPDDGAAPPPVRHTGTWSLTWAGVRTVATLELRQRVRSTRWIVSLVVFGVVVGVVTTLTFFVARQMVDDMGADPTVDATAGRTMFGFIVFFVLFLGLLVSPTLSATSINGDRSNGTLATLQVTLLSPAEIVLGKLLASWVASLAFLAVSVPFIVWAFATGGTAFVGLVTTVLLLAVVLAVVCAIGLGFSALTARTAGSAVLTYVAIAGLTVVSLIVFGLSVPLVSGEERVQVRTERWAPGRDITFDENGRPSEEIPCELGEEERYVTHTERTWWLLAVNPFVVVADALPPAADDTQIADPMTGIRYGVRLARLGAQEPLDECWSSQDWQERERESRERADALGAVWPWGLVFNLLLGAAGVVLAVRRLTIPQAKLPRGTRVA
ncbi:ABC transporter permease [Actinotalea sp. Marseille-Q4924]|uniref:ABC transporter permease n=1 Tax=Actinotalea sp. Marseille-Q4924 TaxID=2866571 RepID=UPI001CE49FD9|nr:ABC transporter permease [Actinotalea sp. Marseille-Q4924]